MEKIGCGTGHSIGLLLNASGTALFNPSLGPTQSLVYGKDHPGLEPMANMVVVRSQPERPFTFGNDSGSIYYASQGCMRYPIAIHTGTGNHFSTHLKDVVLKGASAAQYSLVRETVSIGTSLRSAYEWWRSREVNQDIVYTWWVRWPICLPLIDLSLL